MQKYGLAAQPQAAAEVPMALPAVCPGDGTAARAGGGKSLPRKFCSSYLLALSFCWVFKKLGDPTVCARGREVKAGRGGAGRSGMWWGPWARAGAAPQRVGGSGPAGWVGRWGPWGVGMGPRFQNLSSCPCVSKHTDMHKAYLSL